MKILFQAGGLGRLRGWNFKAFVKLGRWSWEIATMYENLQNTSAIRTRIWWKTFNGEHSDLNNSMDASTDYLNIASTFLAASMKFHQSNIIFNYSLCYAWWPWKPESRYIHIKYFAYRGAVHFQEVSSRMSRRGESETGNWLPTWKWFADYPLNPPHNPKHSSIFDMKRAQLVSEKRCSLVAFLYVFDQVVVPRRWKGVSNFQFMKSGKFNISRNLMIWQMWRLLGGASAHWRWHATIEKKPRFQTICMIWNAFETRSCFISLKMTKLHIILDQIFEHVE